MDTGVPLGSADWTNYGRKAFGQDPYPVVIFLFDRPESCHYRWFHTIKTNSFQAYQQDPMEPYRASYTLAAEGCGGVAGGPGAVGHSIGLVVALEIAVLLHVRARVGLVGHRLHGGIQTSGIVHSAHLLPCIFVEVRVPPTL